MRSMTGYGSGRASNSAGQCVVEIQSVNRKQTEIVVNLPKELNSLDPQIRGRAIERVARGRLGINITFKRTPTAIPPPTVDVNMARTYYQAMQALQKELGATGEIGIETVLRAPGVLRACEDEAIDPAVAWPAVQEALDEALGRLIEMRDREGAALGADLELRLAAIAASLATVAERGPAAAKHLRDALNERLSKAELATPLDEERLAREVAVFADRSDITEETTRLQSHLDQFAVLLKSEKPAGRPMDFLTQEMARELNTLGAKSSDLGISQATLAAKSELDKIREQVQNIE